MKGDRLQLKRASELLVKSIGGIEAAAALLGRGHSTVGRWTNRNDADYSIPLADLRELEANAPEPVVTIALARLAGGVFVPLPQAPGGDQALPLQIMALAKELGEFSGEVGDGLADGDFNAEDARRSLAQLADVEAGAASLRVVLTMIAEG